MTVVSGAAYGLIMDFV